MDFYLDAKLLTDKEEAHKYLAQLLEFPDYYGNNLDALADCLGQMNEITFHILNADEAGEYFQKIMPVLQEKAKIIFE